MVTCRSFLFGLKALPYPSSFPFLHKKAPKINYWGHFLYRNVYAYSFSLSFSSSSFSGKITDKRTEITNTPPTIPNEIGEGI